MKALLFIAAAALCYGQASPTTPALPTSVPPSTRPTPTGTVCHRWLRTIKRFFVAILLAQSGFSAVVSVCSSGCTTTSLQTALDSLANCGDTIQIKSTQTQTGNFTITYRGCAANPITVTSDRAATWLPNTFARVTPSQLGNMAVLSSNNGNPPLIGVLDGSNRPPAGWNFVGVAFTNTNVVGGGSFYIVGFNPLGDAANSSQIADKITFDRCYFYTPSLYTGINVRDLIRGDVTNLTVKNSFFGDGFILGGGTGAETHGIRMLTTAGPITITNNFIINSSSPVFTGGATPSYATYLASGLTGQYNYSWRPWKWNGDPAQPFAADYVTAAQNVHRTGPWTITNVGSTGIITTTGSPPFIAASLLDITGVGGCTIANANNWRNTQLTANTFQLLNFPGCNSAYTSGGAVDEFALTVCTKNQGEFKWGVGMTWQYNVGENSWWANQCGGQFSGFTDTLRSQTDQLGSVASFVDATHLTWTGPYRIGDPATGADSTTVDDLVACSSIPTTGMECHPITSFSGASLVVSPAFSAAPVGTYALWINYTGGAKLENVTLTHNAWKNVDQPVSVLGLSYATFIGDAGYGKTHNISQNLAFSTTSYVAGQRAFNITSAEEDNSTGPSGYTFDHNTFYYPSGLGPFFYLNGLNCGGLCSTSIQTKFDSSAVTNNLWGVSSSGGNGPFSGDAVANIHDVAGMYFTNTLIENNVAPGATIGTGGVGSGNTVSGNLNATWVDPFGGLASSGIFNVQPSSAYYHAATDGTSLGADFTQLPMANNCAVAANVLSCDLTSGINSDAKNTQPCVLEVSPSRNLVSDLDTYSVIASVDPTITPGADLSTRSDVILTGSHIAWPLTGVTPGTTYYWRLQAYGDMEMGSFVATNPATGSGSLRSGKSKLGGKVVIH